MAGTATAPFLFAVASRLESSSSVPVVRCGMHGRGNNLFWGASDVGSTLTSPPGYQTIAWKRGGAFHLLWAWFPLISQRRRRLFLRCGTTRRRESYFSLHSPEIDFANSGEGFPLVTSLIHPQAGVADFPLLARLVRGAGEEHSGFGAGDGDRFFPVEARQELPGARELGLADEKGETALRGHEGCGREQDMVETLDGTQGHEGGGGGREVLGAAGEYIDVRQCKCADGFAQEGYFFVVRFDQGDLRVRRPDFQG